VLPVGARDDTPEYAWAEGVTLRAYDLPDGFDETVRVPGGTGDPASFRVRREGDTLTASTSDAPGSWTLAVVGGGTVTASGSMELSLAVGKG
jgi:alpha-D-xyloside xylohydrolase